MKDVVLDTRYWIEFEKEPSLTEKFRSYKEACGFQVIFTRPNFTDLVKRPNQDRVSEYIAEFTDKYVVVEDYKSDEFRRSEDPLLLVPPKSQESCAQQTVDFGDEKTLRFLFRFFEQSPDVDLPARTKALNDIYNEYGEDMLKLTAFWGHREQSGNKVQVNPSDAEILEYVMRMLIMEHAKQVKKEEKIQPQDFIDLRICANAVYASDIFLSESKWVNQEVIPRACEGIEGLKGPILLSSFDGFFEIIPELC